jgi:putative oxidoreductase
MQLSFAVLRAIVGGLFFGHGMQKLAGWFGGQGMEGTARSFESMRLRPGVAHAAAAGAAEAGGGALVLAGAATPLGAAAISASMITAIRKVHGPKGPWVTDGGYEYNLVLLALLFALTEEGPGRFSLDALRGRRRWGLGWALAELGAGALGSMLAVASGERAARAAAAETPAESGGGGPERARGEGEVAARAL